MSSWFTFDTLNDISLDKLNEISSKVQSALAIDEELLNKLTLKSPDLVAEHSQIDAEERRKDFVRDYLAELLPWETKDEEREILVEECREAIMELSAKEETFTYPFAPPEGVNLFAVRGDRKTAQGASEKAKVEAAGKLTKLEPLPPLLEDFDLDTHVGLIQRLFEVDEELVEMHSKLTGAGDKEKIFWKNYFFHCAYTRYEQGLSIDEIWASKPMPMSTDEIASMTSGEIVLAQTGTHTPKDDSSTELIFEHDSTLKEQSAASSVASVENLSLETGQMDRVIGTPITAVSTISSANANTSESSGSGISYEVLDKPGDGADSDLDDLEAEIARELED